MHVHVLIDSLTWGGAETLLADYAAGAREVGLEVSVGYLADRSEAAGRLRAVGVEPTLVPIRSLLGRRDRLLVRDHLRAVAADVLHTQLGYADFLGGLAARSLGVPSVSTVHVMEWGGPLRSRAKDRLMFRARRRWAGRVITVSEAARHAYLATGRDDPAHVVTVHNGIRAAVRPGAGRPLRRALGIPDEAPVVAIVAVLREGKGHRVAAEAVAALRLEHPDLRLLVLGDGPDRAQIERQLAVAGDAVVMAGFREDVVDLLDDVDVLLHPSRVDALPTALLEALATGTPVIASAVGGIPEIIADGETGVLLEPGFDQRSLAAALGRLLDDPTLRARMAQRGRREFAAHFTAAHWIERLLPVYEAVAADVGRPAALS